MRPNHTDLRQAGGDQARVATCRDNVNFFARKLHKTPQPPQRSLGGPRRSTAAWGNQFPLPSSASNQARSPPSSSQPSRWPSFLLAPPRRRQFSAPFGLQEID